MAVRDAGLQRCCNNEGVNDGVLSAAQDPSLEKPNAQTTISGKSPFNIRYRFAEYGPALS